MRIPHSLAECLKGKVYAATRQAFTWKERCAARQSHVLVHGALQVDGHGLNRLLYHPEQVGSLSRGVKTGST